MMYECLPRAACEPFVKLCLFFHAHESQTTRAPLKPILSSGFMTRGQVHRRFMVTTCVSRNCGKVSTKAGSNYDLIITLFTTIVIIITLFKCNRNHNQLL